MHTNRVVFALAITFVSAWSTVSGQAVIADSIARALEAERLAEQEWLSSSPSSYLATVNRTDFGARIVLTVGRAADNDVVVDEPFIAQHHLSVTVQGDSFLVRALDSAAHFLVSSAEVRSAVVGPSAIGLGRLSLRLSHQRFPAIIVFDPESPRFKQVPTLRHYPVDLSYRFVVSLRPNPHPDTVVILSTRGNTRHALRVGWFDVRVGGTPVSLEAHRLLEPGVGDELVSVFFTDLTTGSETYAVGRYVDPEPVGNGLFVLDFNRAYNPACAFSEHYNCPIPPDANHLKVAIRAGEMVPHGAGH